MCAYEVLRIEVDANVEQIGTAILEIDMYEYGGVLRAEDQPVYFVKVDSDDISEFFGSHPELISLLRFDKDEQEWGMYVIGIGRRRTHVD